MLILTLLFGLAILVVAGIFISIMAKRRKDGTVERPRVTMTNEPRMGRAHGPED